MKKLICLLLTLMLTVLAAAAEEEKTYNVWTMEKLTGTSWNMDLDGDGTADAASVSYDLNEYGDGAFTLTVNGQSVKTDGCSSLYTDVYAMKAGTMYYYYGTLLFVSEYGMSDDLMTYCFFYTDGKLMDAGRIPDIAANFIVSPDGIITVSERARHIGTWYYPSEYMLARGLFYNEEDFDEVYAMCKIPRDNYPMGMIVKSRVELQLLASRFDIAPSLRIPADTQVILSSSDDAAWLCVSSMDGAAIGYLRMSSIEYMDYLNIGGKVLPVDDVFDGIFYAD